MTGVIAAGLGKIIYWYSDELCVHKKMFFDEKFRLRCVRFSANDSQISPTIVYIVLNCCNDFHVIMKLEFI